MSPIVYSIAPRYAAPPSQLTGWFVSPSGSATNNGSEGSPWDLNTALNGAGGTVQPGDTIYLRGGTYYQATPWSSTANLVGSNPFGPRNPAGKIHFKPYPGERPIISDRMVLDLGHDFWFHDIEITNTTTASTDKMGIDVHAVRVGLNRVRSKDHSGNAIGMWKESANSWCEEVRCLNSGFTGSVPGSTYGHGLYSQNAVANQRQLYGVVSFNNFGYGIHIYGESNDILANFDLQTIISYSSGLANGYDFQIGGDDPLVNLFARDLWSYRPGTSARFGYQSASPATVDVRNCLFLGQVYFWNLGAASNFTWQNNDIGIGDPDQRIIFAVDDAASPTYSGWAHSNNRYGKSVSGWGPFTVQRAGAATDYDFTGFKSQVGGEAGTTFSVSSHFGQRIKVRRNTIDSASATVAIFNPSSLSTIAVDMSGVLSIGEQYKIYHDYNWQSLIASGTYAGGSINFPMTGYTPPALLGGSLRGVTPLNASPILNTFLVRIG